MSIRYQIIEQGTVNTLVAIDGENIYTADSRHPHWTEMLSLLAEGDRRVFGMFDVINGVAVKLTALSERISYSNGNIFFDGDKTDGPLAEHLTRCIESGLVDYNPVVKFWEKLASNPSENSREQLYNWLAAHKFTINEEGDIIGYKGFRSGEAGSEWVSINSGTALVNGSVKTGRIPNSPGDVVTMPRADVDEDPHASCSVGLHVGTWGYASVFGDRDLTVEVHVNPRDVVSIPNDSSGQKMRCCRYTVVQKLTQEYATPVLNANEVFNEVGHEAY